MLKSCKFKYFLNYLSTQRSMALSAGEGYNSYVFCDGKIDISPRSTMIDKKIDIVAHGFPPLTPVTLRASLSTLENKLSFSSHSHYLTSPGGTIDVGIDASVGGSYTGIEPMGLFWSMSPNKGSQSRFISVNVEQPYEVKITAFEGHHNEEQLNILMSSEIYNKLPTSICERHYMSSKVRREVISTGRIRGTLFLPTNAEEPVPGIIYIFGGIQRGKVMEEKAALMASHGFATMALAYFGVDGLPKNYSELHFDYFEEAVELLKSKKEVKSDSVGLYGMSKGGDIILTMAAFIPDIKALVWLNGCSVNMGGTMQLKDRKLDILGFDPTKIKVFDEERNIMDPLGVMNDVKLYPDADIPFEHTKADLLFLASEDDHNWDSVSYAMHAKEKMDKVGKKNYEIITYPNAGHIIDLPYTPFCNITTHALFPKGYYSYNGGQMKPHSLATEKIWWKTIEFFTEKLN